MTAVTLNLAFYRVAFKSGGTVLMIWIKRGWFCGFGQKDEELVVAERKEESVGVSHTLLPSPQDKSAPEGYQRGGRVCLGAAALQPRDSTLTT